MTTPIPEGFRVMGMQEFSLSLSLSLSPIFECLKEVIQMEDDSVSDSVTDAALFFQDECANDAAGEREDQREQNEKIK